MSDDWRKDDPFVNPDDPDALAREQRRREREERRRKREEKRRPAEEPIPPSPPAAPRDDPPPTPRTPEEEFWDEEPAEVAAAGAGDLPGGVGPDHAARPSEPEHDEAARSWEPQPEEATPPPPPPPKARRAGGGGRSRTWLLLGGLALLIAVGVAVAALAVVNRDEPPPPEPPKVISLTIPEGLNREQTAEVAEEAGLRGDYVKASVRSRFLNPARYGGKGAESLEGFLFPDTFELNAKAPVGDLVQLQLEDFKGRLAGVDLSYARAKNLTVYDVVTIASMVEEEAMLDGERPLIAAVIYNRLKEGIPLGIDATIRFATGNYTEPLTESELATDSPYNTRLNAGLPPGPIGNPGLASLEAAARPAKTDYLYYVVKPGTCGKHSFSRTDVEFQADVARYNEAREAAGGESPDSCP